jgi:hypothetical protein
VADDWCWFVLREKYSWLVADKPNEQGVQQLSHIPDPPPVFYKEIIEFGCQKL